MLNDNIKLIAFDADDTLWINEYHYRKAEEKFGRLMEKFVSPDVANQMLLKTEKDNLPLLGYGSKPFIISLIETGIEISRGTLSNDEILELIKIGKETIGRKIELMPEVVEVLSGLSGKYPIILATKGDLKEQESKIERSGLEQYFSHIEIMSEKNSENYLKIIRMHNIEPENFLMVGNSFKSDILPVLEIGGNALYIPSDITWAHEVVEEIEHPKLIRAERLSKALFGL
ncbi:MAG: HAD family hydrolase [Bacteroidales bacterium]